MFPCPACSYKNLPGAETCEGCGTHLAANAKDPSKVTKQDIHDTIEKVGMRNPVIVSPKTKAKQVLAELKKADVGCALVVDQNEFLGIFTERDVLHRLAKPGIDLNDIEIENIMTPRPEVLKETDPVSMALNMMAMGNFRHVPIALNNGGFSIFSVRDALRYFF